MIIITGAAGFIGSCLVTSFSDSPLWVVDDFSFPEKMKNLEHKKIERFSHRDQFPDELRTTSDKITCVIHIGARTDTTEFNRELLNRLNFNYTQQLWRICAEKKIPFIYASSAATYGLGEYGYDDKNEANIFKLKPLNPYGDSKNDFDKWALQETEKPPYWIGLKFFNVYGPNEYHKGRMASVIFHAFNQIKEKGEMKLFRSHRPDYKDGEQLRDFIYVKDVIKVIRFFAQGKAPNGIYNLGTGKARTFLDLAKNTFTALGLPENIHFIDTPLDIRDKYQYFTEATMDKLKDCGYMEAFYSLEEGVSDYVKHYLMEGKYF